MAIALSAGAVLTSAAVAAGTNATRPARSGPPSGIVASPFVQYADGDGLKVISVDGRHVVGLTGLGLAGPTERTAPTDQGVVFLRQGSGYLLTPPYPAQPKRLGAASYVFSAAGGLVGLDQGRPPDRVSVRFVDGAGKPALVSARAGAGVPITLPAGRLAVADLPTGLLLQDPTSMLEIWDPATGMSRLTFGPIRSLIDVHGSLVAWTDGWACDRAGGCPLHVTDTVTDVDRQLFPPANFDGFAGGGAFSPDGSLLAGFITSRGPEGSVLQGVLIHLDDTGRVDILNPTAAMGGSVGAAGWTSDGYWLLFDGLSGPLYAYHAGQPDPYAIPLPAPTAERVSGP